MDLADARPILIMDPGSDRFDVAVRQHECADVPPAPRTMYDQASGSSMSDQSKNTPQVRSSPSILVSHHGRGGPIAGESEVFGRSMGRQMTITVSMVQFPV